MRLFRFGLWMVLPLALAACGGGGGGGCLLGGAVACSAPAPANVAPVAKVASVPDVVLGSTVTLDATGSTDANQDLLTYAWTWLSQPNGSQLSFSPTDAVSAKPSFQPSVSGAYVLSLTVFDGKAYSTPVAMTFQVAANKDNVAPVADARTLQPSVKVNDKVTLDGSFSYDGNGDPITYNWTLFGPDGKLMSSLDLTYPVHPSFTASVAGTYVATLVVSDGLLSSTLSSVRVVASVANAAPVANAGSDQRVVVGAKVYLDGTASSDADGNALTYSWSFLAKPTNPINNVPSSATLDSPTVDRPRFTADLAGTYVLGLTVNDGKSTSANTAVVTVTAAEGNVAPVADAGPGQTVTAGQTTPVQLDGTRSYDANGDPLTYTWTLLSKPLGSSVDLLPGTATSPTPLFFAAQAGSYVFSLMVNDGKVNSQLVTTSVTAQ